jgi:hypothetical protein
VSFSGVHHLADGRTDNVHFLCGKPIAPRKITRGASRSYVAFDVRQTVVNSIKTARAFNGSAIHARLDYEAQNFCRSQVAGIYPLVGFAKEHCPTLICLAIFFVAGLCAVLLRGGHVNPPFLSAVAAFFAGVVTLLTLIRQAKGPRPLTMKIVRSRSK